MKCLRTEPSLRLYLPTCFQLEPWKGFTKQYASFQISAKESILSKLYCYTSFSSKDQLEELQYDVDNAVPDIGGWKAHILRAAHQDTAKSAVIKYLSLWTGLWNFSQSVTGKHNEIGLGRRESHGVFLLLSKREIEKEREIEVKFQLRLGVM